MSLFSELKRRNVFRVGAAYIVIAWLIIQVAETIFPLFGFGDEPARLVVIVLAIGFVPVLIISWTFELTPQGLMRESEIDPEDSITPRTGKKLDRMIMVALVIGLAYFAFDKFVLDPQRDVEITESAARAGAEQAREEARLGMFNEKSVAVLPFANRSDNKEDEYFTDGMHDELLTRLSRIAALKVISRTSVLRYRGTEKSVPEIARELSVATILEGGVQRSGSQVRINVQLIDAHTDEHLWAEIYDRELTAENLFAIQSEISTAIADALKATLSPEEKSRVYELPTYSLEAYNHYLRGRQLMATRKAESLQQAQAEFKLATEIDPDFALAWVGVADSDHLLIDTRAFSADRAEHQERHRQAIDRALLLNDQLGEAYASLAFYYEDLDEFDKATAAMQRAIELSPNYAQAYHWYSHMQTGPDRIEQRLQLLYKAAQLDPLSSIVQLNIADALYRLGREEEGRQQLLHLLDLDSDFAIGHWQLANYDFENGRLANAVQSYRRAMQLDPANGRLMLQAAQVHIALGDYEAVADIREGMDRHLGVGNVSGRELDHLVRVAESRWQEIIEVVNSLPQERRKHPAVVGALMRTYSNSGNFDEAYQLMLVNEPNITNREQWQQEYGDWPACSHAGILIEAGYEELGQDFVRFFIRNLEASRSGRDPTIGMPRGWIVCHLVNGSFDKALDILDRESGQGRLLDQWWRLSKMYWWRRLEDNSRYIELVDRIDTMLAEQRELLREMDVPGDHVP